MNTNQSLREYLEEHAEDYFRDEQGSIWLGVDLLEARATNEGPIHHINGGLYLQREERGVPLVSLFLWPVVSPQKKRHWPEPAEVEPLVGPIKRRVEGYRTS